MDAAAPRLPAWIAPWRAVLLAAAYVVGFALIDWLTYIRPFHALNVTPWNPQTALAIAVLLWNRRWFWVVWLSLVVAEMLVRGAPSSWALLLSATAALALAYAAIAGAVSQRLRSPVLSTRADVGWLAALCAGGALLTSVVYVTTFALVQLGAGRPLIEALVRYWIGDAVGLVVLLPVVLMLRDGRRRRALAEAAAKPATWLLGVLTAMLLVLVFRQGENDEFRYFYLLFAPVVWAAARGGLPGAVLVAAWTQGGVILASQAVHWADVTVFELQALLVAIAMTGLVIGVAVDERERAAEDLKGTLRLAAAGEMAAALAHEMSQPLTALHTYAGAVRLVMSTPGLDDRERLARLADVAGRMADETQRAGDVVSRLRDFFRSGDTRLERIAPATVVMQAIEACDRSAQSLGLTLRGHADPRLPEVLVDPIQVAVVLRNLIRNALDATAAQRGHVEVRVSEWRDAVRFDVIDDGPGVEDGRRERLFEPGPSAKPGGMGVGLSICRAIVEAHGGRLWMEDGEHGHFVFTVPLDVGRGHGR